MRTAWPLIAGVMFLALAPALFFTNGWGRPDRSIPVDLRLPADGGWAQSAPFRPSPSGSYRASLKLDRRFPHHEMECLADVGMPFSGSTRPGRHPDCPAAFAPARLEWAILRKGRALSPSYDFGPHAGEYSGDTVGRSLGTFDLQPGAAYVVRARLVAASPNLSATKPRLRIYYGDPASLIVGSLLFTLLAGASAIAGVVLLIVGLVRAIGAA